MSRGLTSGTAAWGVWRFWSRARCWGGSVFALQRQSLTFLLAMERAVHDLATLIFLGLEVECARCGARFAEPQGDGEAELWQWAQKTATAAYDTGWREFAGRLFCRECFEQEKNNG